MDAPRSTIDPNPYAPSAVADPRQELVEAGVGVWRDGGLIVLHRDARLPAICLKTGQPATRWFTFQLSWGRPLFLGRREILSLRLPLSERRHYLASRRWVLLGWGLIMLFVLVGFAPYLHWLSDRDQALFIFGIGSLMVTLVLTGVALGEPVQLWRARGDYLWISGAGERFLAQLPVWPHAE
jgi:hypothetical protein